MFKIRKERSDGKDGSRNFERSGTNQNNDPKILKRTGGTSQKVFDDKPKPFKETVLIGGLCALYRIETLPQI